MVNYKKKYLKYKNKYLHAKKIFGGMEGSLEDYKSESKEEKIKISVNVRDIDGCYPEIILEVDYNGKVGDELTKAFFESPYYIEDNNESIVYVLLGDQEVDMMDSFENNGVEDNARLNVIWSRYFSINKLLRDTGLLKNDYDIEIEDVKELIKTFHFELGCIRNAEKPSVLEEELNRTLSGQANLLQIWDNIPIGSKKGNKIETIELNLAIEKLINIGMEKIKFSSSFNDDIASLDYIVSVDDIILPELKIYSKKGKKSDDNFYHLICGINKSSLKEGEKGFLDIFEFKIFKNRSNYKSEGSLWPVHIIDTLCKKFNTFDLEIDKNGVYVVTKTISNLGKGKNDWSHESLNYIFNEHRLENRQELYKLESPGLDLVVDRLWKIWVDIILLLCNSIFYPEDNPNVTLKEEKKYR